MDLAAIFRVIVCQLCYGVCAVHPWPVSSFHSALDHIGAAKVCRQARGRDRARDGELRQIIMLDLARDTWSCQFGHVSPRDRSWRASLLSNAARELVATFLLGAGARSSR